MELTLRKESRKDREQTFWIYDFKTGDQLLVFPKKNSKFNSITLNKGSERFDLIKKDTLKLIDFNSILIGKYSFFDIIMAIAKHDFSSIENDSEKIIFEEKILEEADLSSLKKLKINKDKYQLSINKLRKILNDSTSIESDFQKWIEDNRWIFAGIEILDSQFQLSTTHGTSKPDFLFCDPFGKGKNILEIKKASFELLKLDPSRGTYYWTSEISKSISQVRKYLDDLNENPRIGNNDAKRITINTYGIILAGRTKADNNDLMWSLNGLNNELRNIKIISYDVLLENLEKNWNSFYGSEKNE